MARTHVVISDQLLQAIDKVVGERGRSRFIEEAAREKLDRLELEGAIQATAGILSQKDYPQWRDPESISEWVRETRRGRSPA
jgi:metal-responsive CopG/Arc/MetJ family transcriptional regulator